MGTISVIIPSYNRTDFLWNAIKSVLNQTLDKKYYEIIVVKNYNDDKMDSFINKNNIKNIFSTNKSLPGKIYEALKIASGDIISFLDDDDLFFSNKLEYVYNIFKNNENLVYYHNNYYPVDCKGKYKNFIENSIDFNNSCINIKKDTINLNKLKKISALTDTFFYLSALDYGGKKMLDKKILTYYTVHNGVSNFITDNFDDYKNKQIEFLDISIDELFKFKDLFNNKKVLKHIYSYITDIKMNKFLWGFYNERPSKIINFILHRDRPLKNRIAKLSYYIIVRLYPSYFIKYAYKKRKNDFIKKI